MNQNNSDKKPNNPLENFDMAYSRERKLQEEFEKIEIAYSKTAEKYKDYAECLEFAHYLKTIEKVFAEAKTRNWDADKVKDSLIEVRIKILSEETSINESVLQSIHDDFKKMGTDIGKINEAAQRLLDKYKEEKECSEFILYIQYILINFSSFKEGELNMTDMKDRLVSARMQVLSSDGKPDLKTLETIYKEFKDLLS